MATETLKSAAITSIDANPPVRSTTGKGGAGVLRVKNGFVTPTTGYLTGSNYLMVRVPSNSVVKHVLIDYNGTITTMTGDVTVFYSDETGDEVGKSAGLTGVVNSLSTTAALFGTAIALGSQTAGVVVDITNESGNYPPSARNKELWDACGLTSDPGGAFDIVFMNTSTMNVSGATVNVEVQYITPAP
jgi:hypothetical protein